MEYRGLVLDAFQTESIRHLEEGRSVLVAAPTGTGKTIIADWIVEQALEANQQVVYTAPIKALSNQKFRDYTRLFGDRAGLVTGDLVIRRDAPCRVMTTEILRNMLLMGEQLPDLRAVVVDEIHFLDDRERGTVWEELLIYLPPEVQIVGLSATLSNLDDFAAWLTEVRQGPVEVIVEEERAVPLTFHYAHKKTGLKDPQAFDKMMRRKGRSNSRRGRGRRSRGRRRRRHTSHHDIFRMAAKAKYLPMLYFVFSRRETELCARALARSVNNSLLSREEQKRMDARLQEAAKEMGPALDPEIRELYACGVAFHHAGVHVQLKALVESLYEEKLIKVLYCTSTFALGINMPARAVAFDSLKKYDGRSMKPLTTREFMQMAGRAGRRGMDETGHVMIRMDYEDYEEYKPLLDRYARGGYEPVRSTFSLSWNSIVNLLETHTEEQIRRILDKSFLSWFLTKKVARDRERASALEGSDNNRKDQKEARRLRRKASRDEGRVWTEFQGKVGFLQGIGYIDENHGFNAGARILRHLQISEIPMTELVLSGLIEELSPNELFGVLCAVTNELPRHAQRNFKAPQSDRALAKEIGQIFKLPAVLESDEITQSESTWDPDLITIGRGWAEGKTLQEILLMVSSDTDISGDMVNGFRRAKDLASQLKDVYSELPERQAEIRRLIKAVSRDEVLVVD